MSGRGRTFPCLTHLTFNYLTALTNRQFEKWNHSLLQLSGRKLQHFLERFGVCDVEFAGDHTAQGGEMRAAAEHDDEQAGGIRVERAAVADFLDAELATNRVHNVVGRGAAGFINEERAVEGGEFLHDFLQLEFSISKFFNRKRRKQNCIA